MKLLLNGRRGSGGGKRGGAGKASGRPGTHSEITKLTSTFVAKCSSFECSSSGRSLFALMKFRSCTASINEPL